MTGMRQCGDPVCPDCLCQHHAEEYAEMTPTGGPTTVSVNYDTFINGATIVQTTITITETCCVIVNAAMNTLESMGAVEFEIERPLGTIRTQQEDTILLNELYLLHHASWEVLPPGIYTYYLVNRSVGAVLIPGAWIKAIASDCEG